jgi:hypothetical protein
MPLPCDYNTISRSKSQNDFNITNTILYIFHGPGFYLKHNISETGFCLRLQVVPIQWAEQTELVPVYGEYHLKKET